MSWKNVRPACSVCIGVDKVIESYYTGTEFFKKIWRIPEDQKVDICFGHEFFFWVTHAKNASCWLKNKCGTNLLDFDSWNKCYGYLEFNRRKALLIIHVVNTK